jgi:FAD:protein FMN transferase
MTAVLDRYAALPTAVWTDWSCLVRVVVTDQDALGPATADVEALMRRVELAASRFRPDSELCRANARAGRPTAISRTLIGLLDAGLVSAAETNGAVDPTLGRELERLGYDRDIASISDSDELPRTRAGRRVTWRDVRLDRAHGLLTVPLGAAIDLGATAKAQTADWAASALARRYGCGVLVEIGGDLAVAGAEQDWQVTVAERVGAAGQQVTLRGGGLATSTTTIRRWRRGDSVLHHIVDPATAMPAAGPWRTVTVAAETATRANTCATAAIVLGDEALGWLTARGVAARLVDQAGGVVTIGGWPR